MNNKILIFNETCPGGNYGVKTYIVELERYFHFLQNFEIHIINMRSSKNEFTVIQESKTFFYEIPKEVFWRENQDVYYRNVIYLLRTQINTQSSRIFFQINYFEHLPLTTYIKQQYPMGKIIFTLHYLDWSFIIQGNTSYFRTLITRKREDISVDSTAYRVLQLYEREKKMFDLVDTIICLSKYAEDLLANDYGVDKNKVELVHNGLPYNGNKEVTTRNALREKYLFDSKEKIILYVGRLDRAKGGQELIRAFKIVMGKYPKSRLIIVGSGKEGIYLEECEGCWSKIVMTGQIRKELVYDFYKIADVGVLPSFTEQCSYVAIEMMMHGLPIIGTTATGLSEMIVDGVNGYKVELKENNECTELDFKELAIKICHVLSMGKEEYTKMSMNSYEMYNRKYTHSGMSEQLGSIFKKFGCKEEMPPLSDS